ncbi:hypothetical protein Tco_0381791 [Tanacetum coccineum]
MRPLHHHHSPTATAVTIVAPSHHHATINITIISSPSPPAATPPKPSQPTHSPPYHLRHHPVTPATPPPPSSPNQPRTTIPATTVAFEKQGGQQEGLKEDQDFLNDSCSLVFPNGNHPINLRSPSVSVPCPQGSRLRHLTKVGTEKRCGDILSDNVDDEGRSFDEVIFLLIISGNPRMNSSNLLALNVAPIQDT